jgi:DNA modification methylase
MLDYQTFLQSKKTIAQTSGIEVPLDAIHPMLFDFQKELVRWALRKGRCALFVDTGLGKTFMSVEFARLTGQRTLIVAPLSVARQTVNEAMKIDVEVHYTRSGDDIIDGINITNYEMIGHFNPDDFGCVVLDESSVLKSMTGAICTKLIEMFVNTPYRLCCTATPAPNDHVELGTHAKFLGIMTEQEMKATYFVHDAKTSAHGGWRLKGHAEQAFYQWLASWSMSVKKPSDLGSRFSDEGYNLPPLHIERAIVECDYVPEGQLFFSGLKGVSDRAKVRKGTLEERVVEAVKLIESDENNEQWIIWCGLNDESSTVSKAIPGAVELAGKDSPDKKIQTIEDFQSGKIRVLVTKAKIAGMGINLQNCHNQIWLGLNDSFEIYYQGVRRSLRFGQQSPVYVYIVLSDIEEDIFQNVLRKEEEAKKMSDELIKNVQQFEQNEIEHKQEQKVEYQEDIIRTDDYTLMLGDSCQRLKEIASNSGDLLITSVPFEALYTYYPGPEDIGNCKSPEQFMQHLGYVIDELLRIMKPCRNVCVHVSQIPMTLIHDGVIGIRDFRGNTIQAFVEKGFIYHSDITVDKNPQVASVRSHAKGLAFQQLEKDTIEMRSTFADYILVFKKPGKNAVPIKQQLTRDEWIQWASAVWYGIRQTDTLNVEEAREAKDEKHVCPLQLDLIERLVKLYSNPGEIVLDPFTGIGSTGYVALELDRKFVGIELKPSYFETAKKNLERMLKKRTQATLWEFAEAEAV